MDRRAFLRTASWGLPILAGCSSRSVPEFSEQTFNTSQSAIHAIAISSDGKKIATGHSALHPEGMRVTYVRYPNGYVRLWESLFCSETGLVAADDLERMPFPYVDDEGGIWVMTENRLLKCDAAGSVLDRLHRERVLSADVRRQRLVAAIDEEPSCLVVTDLAGQAISKVLQHPNGHSIHAEIWRGFSANGQLLATKTFASRDPAEVVIWDWEVAEIVARFEVASVSAFWATAFNPDSCSVAIMHSSHELRLFDIRTHRFIRSFECKVGRNSDLCFSPNGQRIAVCGEGETKKPGQQFGFLRVWDVTTGRVVMDVKRPDVWGITAIEFAPDGSTLYAGLSNGELVSYRRSTEA